MWDDGLSSLSSFTAESESDFQSPTSPTWSSFSRRSSGEGNTSSIFDVPELSRSNSDPSISLSDEDLGSSLDNQSPTPLALSVLLEFHPGTSAETIRPSPSQLIGLRLSERPPSETFSGQRSRSSSQSSSVTSSSSTRPVSPYPSERSRLSMQESDEDYEDDISHNRDVEDNQDDNLEEDHQDVSEVETVYDRRSSVMGGPHCHDVRGDRHSTGSGQPEDGEGSSSGYHGSGRYSNTSSNGYGYGGLGARSSGTHRPTGGASGSGGGRDGDGRRPSHPWVSLHGKEEDGDTDSTDDYGEDEPSPKPRRPTVPIRKQPSDEDDVPLARSIPTALKAQKTIRSKVREENAQRRQERTMRMQAKIRNVSGVPQSAGPGTTVFQHERTSPSRTVGRARTLTLPSSTAAHRPPFAVDDLTKKLMDVQASMTGPINQELHRSGTRSTPQSAQEPGPSSKSRRPSQELPKFPPPPAPSYPIQDTFQKPTLRPMRSFHRPATALQPETREPPPSSGSGGAGITHSRSLRRPRTGDPTNQPSTSPSSNFSLQRSKSTKPQDQPRPPDEDYGSTSRPSTSPPSVEVSVDFRAHWSEKVAALPPVPPIPTYDTLMRQKSGETWQQKVFLGDVQRSTIVEVGTSTSAQDVIDTIERRGEIGPHDPNNNGGKGWMLFELAQDFGMGTFFPRSVVVRQLNMSIHRATDSLFRGPCRH